jgi:uncharacterized glyoxalase superfamily protein PhnB
MAKKNLSEQLDTAVQALLAHPTAAAPAAVPALAELVQLAADLRDLPHPDFRTRLESNLRRKAAMTTATAKPVRAGIQAVTPYLVVREAEQLIEFVREAFGAKGRVLGIGSEGGLHAEFTIGDSKLMIGGGGKWRGTPLPGSLHLYVKDADTVYRRAVAAGARLLYEPVDQAYGDREAGVEDASGNQWWIATHKATGEAPPGFRTLTPGLRVEGAPRLIEFLKQAFGAEEISRTESQPGVIVHAELRLGDAVLELGEAHGRWGPISMMLHLLVDDVDACYRRALAGGAASVREPADQPYGGRDAGVADPFGNQWWMASPLKGRQTR